MNAGRYCLKCIINDIHVFLLYFKTNISTHSYNVLCLHDVFPAKQLKPPIRTARDLYSQDIFKPSGFASQTPQ